MARRGRYIDFHDVTFFAEQLRNVPREVQPAIRKVVKDAGTTLTQEMQSRASWSSRIPAAVKTRVSFAARGSGITIYVDRKAAPHARPYEGLSGGGNRGTFRHPVFGNRDVWVAQATRPFFQPAIEAKRKQFVADLETALIRTLPKG